MPFMYIFCKRSLTFNYHFLALHKQLKALFQQTPFLNHKIDIKHVDL